MRLSLRPATTADLEWCEAIDRAAMSPYLDARGIAWDPQRFRDDWGRFENWLIAADGEPVGLLRMCVTDGALEIRDLQVRPENRGHGIGAWAVAQAKAIALQRGFDALRLRVYEENPARALYARLGFVERRVDGGLVHMAYAQP